MKSIIDNINSNWLHFIGGFAIAAIFLIYGTAPLWALIVCALIGAAFEINQLRSLCPDVTMQHVKHSLSDLLLDLAGGLGAVIIYYIGKVIFC